MNPGRTFSLPMEARDYECDLQGIVNNSVYLNYFEHTRHSFLKSIGLDFHRLHTEGLDAVVRRIEIDYRRSLTGTDEFTSSLRISMKGRLQCVFDQSIHRLPDGEEVEVIDEDFLEYPDRHLPRLVVRKPRPDPFQRRADVLHFRGDLAVELAATFEDAPVGLDCPSPGPTVLDLHDRDVDLFLLFPVELDLDLDRIGLLELRRRDDEWLLFLRDLDGCAAGEGDGGEQHNPAPDAV